MERHHQWTVDPGPISFTLLYRFTFTRTIYFTCITIILLPLDTLNPLFTVNQWDWQPHRKLGAKYLFVLCAGFTLLLGEDTLTSSLSGALVRSVTKLASITFLSLAFSYWIDYLSFITEGKLAAVFITPSLGVPNWSVIYIINTAPSMTWRQRKAITICIRLGDL
jgi:hypothetical protein